MMESDLTVGLLAGQDQDCVAGSLYIQTVALAIARSKFQTRRGGP